MKLRIGKPYPMFATEVEPVAGEAINVVARRFSKAQRKLEAVPYFLEDDKGTVVDCGFISIDVKAMKVVVDHRNEEVAK